MPLKNIHQEKHIQRQIDSAFHAAAIIPSWASHTVPKHIQEWSLHITGCDPLPQPEFLSFANKNVTKFDHECYNHLKIL